MKISDLVKEAHAASVAKGFYPKEENRNVGEMLMLIVSELGEALEADRKGRHSPELFTVTAFESQVKDTFEDEIADAVIRLADLAGYLSIDLEAHIAAKMRYNKTRPYRHGKAY
jgi:NTP pyrophosphatase (non-canonical NTP hydrolase)